MPSNPEDAISAPPAADKLPSASAPWPQEPAATPSATASQAPARLPPSIAGAFAAAAYALQHGDDAMADAPGQRSEESTQDSSLLPGLYASAIGEPSRDYYLRLFARFDALDKGLPTWNLAAGLFTLPWCGMRGLWREAGLYALVTAGMGLLWLMVLRPLLALPPAIAHGIDASLVLLAVAVPGLGANARYWQHVRRHTLQAIAQAPTMSQAHQQLARHAVTALRRRLAFTAGLALAVAAGTAIWWRTAPAMASPTPAAAQEQLPAQQPGTQPIQAPAQVDGKVDVKADVQANVQANVQADALADAAVDAQADAKPQAGIGTDASHTDSGAEAAPAAPPASAPVAAGAVAATMASAVPVALATASNSTSTSTGMVAGTAAAPIQAPAPAQRSTPAQPAAAKAVQPSAPARQAVGAAPSSPTALEPGHFYINIGVFSDAANARRAVSRIEKAKLPAMQQTLSSNKGEITRVRSGPYAQQRSAEQAARKLRKLQLQATVFQHAPAPEGKSAKR